MESTKHRLNEILSALEGDEDLSDRRVRPGQSTAIKAIASLRLDLSKKTAEIDKKDLELNELRNELSESQKKEKKLDKQTKTLESEKNGLEGRINELECKVSDDLNKILKIKNLNAVYISSQPSSHYILARKALLSNREY